MLSFRRVNPLFERDTALRPDQARLIVITPHWSASVSVVDNDLRPVAGIGPVRQWSGEGGNLGRAESLLRPGAYQVAVTLSGAAQTRWVALQSGHATIVRAEVWDALAAPARAPSGLVPEWARRIWQEIEQSRHDAAGARPAADEEGHAAGYSDTRLSLVLASGDGTQASTESETTFRLLDGAGSDVAQFGSGWAAADGAGLRHWSASIPCGYYILIAPEDMAIGKGRILRPGHRYQPLYLSAGWQTNLFLTGKPVPRLASMAIVLTRPGEQLDPGCDQAVAVEAVRAALANPSPERAVLGSERILQLLRAGDLDPWLGVLSAYALLPHLTSDAPSEAADLLEHIAETLADQLGDHPDLRAIMLDDPKGRTKNTLDYPPMLRVGLDRVHRIARTRPGVVARNSLLAEMTDVLIADSQWTAWWKEEVRLDDRAPVPDTLAPQLRELRSLLPAAAPVYPLMLTTAASADSGLATAIQIIKTASNLIRKRGQEPVRRALVPSAKGGDEGAGDGGGADAAAAIGGLLAETRADQASALNAAVRSLAAGEESGKDWLRSAQIEDQIQSLRREVARLRSCASDHDGQGAALRADVAEALKNITLRIEALADRLTERARLVVVTDAEGRLLYGNRGIRDRLQQQQAGEDVLEHLRRELKRHPAARALVEAKALAPDSPEAQHSILVEVLHTVLHDPDGDRMGNVYVLRNSETRDLSPRTAELVEKVLRQITLFASIFQHSSQIEQRHALAKLQQLIYRLEVAPG